MEPEQNAKLMLKVCWSKFSNQAPSLLQEPAKNY